MLEFRHFAWKVQVCKMCKEQVFPEKALPAHRPDKPGSFFQPGSSRCIRSCSTLRVKNGLFSKCASVWSRAQQVTLATFSAYGQEFWPMRMWLLSMANGHIWAWEDKNFCLNLCLWWLRQLGPTIAPFLQMVQDFVWEQCIIFWRLLLGPCSMRHSGHFLFSYLSAGFHTLVSAFVRHWASMHKQGICHFKAEIRYWGTIVEKAIRLLPTQCRVLGKANEAEPTFLRETIGMGEKKRKYRRLSRRGSNDKRKVAPSN